MTTQPFIFCISVNCSPITAVMLKSFHRHHPNNVIHVMGTPTDFDELGPIGKYPNTNLVDISGHEGLIQKFKQGHSGTTSVFAMVIQKQFGNYDRFIHIDGDVYFKKNCIDVVEKAFTDGSDIVGTRRCYGNNPSGIKNLEQFPDTISTYFFGMKLDKIPQYPFDKLCRYCEGAEHPLGWLVLDAFDGITHATMQNGGKLHFLDQNEFGSQDVHGKKINNYKSNMHMDCGSHLIHWGGVGSGHAFHSGKSKPEHGYSVWALGRYSLFRKIYYGDDIGHTALTVYGEDTRWINGNYDQEIYNQILIDLEN